MHPKLSALKDIVVFRWNPNWDLAAVAFSWVLVTGALYTATVIFGPEASGGLIYFGLYAVLAATVYGLGIPLYWLVVVRKRPLADLGITTKFLGLSLALQLFLGIIQYIGALRNAQYPPLEQLIPLIALGLSIGFFEAVFWRGWVLLRLEEAFGLLPAILIGSALYALYHIGYAMPFEEVRFLFLVGILFAVVFRLTKNVFVLWPVYQPMGQLITLLKDQLTLPLISALGFAEVLVVMLVLVWLASKYARRHSAFQPSMASFKHASR